MIIFVSSILLTCIFAVVNFMKFTLNNRSKVHESFDIDDETCDDIIYAFKQFINGGKRICSNRRNVALHQTLKDLADDTSTKICKFDKKRGVSILNANDYFEKLESIYNDHSKYRDVV